MSVSYLLWNLGNYLSITALCQQICLPSIISNATDHKNEIWKTVKLTSSYYLYSPSQSSVLDSLSTIKHSNFQIILAHQEAFCLTFCSTVSKKGRFTREAIDYWRPMGRLIYITTLRCLVVPSESKNIPTPCSQNLQKLVWSPCNHFQNGRQKEWPQWAWAKEKSADQHFSLF